VPRNFETLSWCRRNRFVYRSGKAILDTVARVDAWLKPIPTWHRWNVPRAVARSVSACYSKKKPARQFQFVPIAVSRRDAACGGQIEIMFEFSPQIRFRSADSGHHARLRRDLPPNPLCRAPDIQPWMKDGIFVLAGFHIRIFADSGRQRARCANVS